LPPASSVSTPSAPLLQLDCLDLFGRAARNRAALDGRHVLVGMEAEAHQVAKAADAPPAPRRPDGVRCILDDPQPVARCQLIETLHIDRQPGEVHRQDRTRARGDRRLRLLQIHVARIEVDVDEYGPGTYTHDDVRRGDEAHRRSNHLISRADAAGEQGHLQSRRRRSLSPYRSAAEIGRQLGFELRDLRSARQPARAQHLRYRGDGLLVDHGPRERQPRLRRVVHERATSTTPTTMTPIPATRCALGTSPSSHHARPTLMM